MRIGKRKLRALEAAIFFTRHFKVSFKKSTANFDVIFLAENVKNRIPLITNGHT